MVNCCYLLMSFERQANMKLICLKRDSMQQHPFQITSRVWDNPKHLAKKTLGPKILRNFRA